MSKFYDRGIICLHFTSTRAGKSQSKALTYSAYVAHFSTTGKCQNAKMLTTSAAKLHFNCFAHKKKNLLSDSNGNNWNKNSLSWQLATFNSSLHLHTHLYKQRDMHTVCKLKTHTHAGESSLMCTRMLRCNMAYV